jgi:alginate O-acetyltransferase complex protein AlgI
LSKFLRDYIYIPLGGNRKNNIFTSRNIIITFLIGGIWHGAGWTFVFWGGCMGVHWSFTGCGAALI